MTENAQNLSFEFLKMYEKKWPEQDESDGVIAFLRWAIFRTFENHKNDEGSTVGIPKVLFSSILYSNLNSKIFVLT